MSSDLGLCSGFWGEGGSRKLGSTKGLYLLVFGGFWMGLWGSDRVQVPCHERVSVSGRLRVWDLGIRDGLVLWKLRFAQR